MEITPSVATSPALLNEGGRLPVKPDEQAEAARQFEAMLLRQFIQEAFKPLLDETMGGAGKDVYQYLMTDALADSLARSEMFGISSLIQLQLAGSGGEVSSGASAQPSTSK